MLSAKLSLGANDKASVGREFYARPFLLFYPYSPKCLEKPSEKALRCLQRRALQAYEHTTFWPVWPPYSGQITVGALLEPLFGQFLEGYFSETGLQVYIFATL